jgi:exosortase
VKNSASYMSGAPEFSEREFFKPEFSKRSLLICSQAGVIFLLAAWLYLPLALRLASQWWQDPNYTHGFFVPVFSLFLLWEKRRALVALPTKPAWSGLMILLVALLALMLGTVNAGFFLYRISLLFFVAGLVVFLAGWRHLAAISFPLGFLILMIPSTTLLEQITLPLQMVASKAATFLLMIAGVPAVREGNIILLPTARLEVAEACSGIRSLFSLITLTVIYGYLAESRTGVRVLLAALAIPISVLANALRIAVTGLVVETWGIQGAEGTLHLLSGWLIFAGSLALIFLFHRFSKRFIRSRDVVSHDDLRNDLSNDVRRKAEPGVREEYA